MLKIIEGKAIRNRRNCMMAGRFALTMIARQAGTGRSLGFAAEQGFVAFQQAGRSWQSKEGVNGEVRGEGRRLLSLWAGARDADAERIWAGLERGKTATALWAFQGHGRSLCSTPRGAAGGEGDDRNKKKKSQKEKDGEGGEGFDPFMFGIKVCVAGTFCYSAWATLPYALDQVLPIPNRSNEHVSTISSSSPPYSFPFFFFFSSLISRATLDLLHLSSKSSAAASH